MISLIVAYDKNRVIGHKGKLPWNIPGELSRFRELTRGKVLIMGRRTFEEIGKPLPERTTIVVSRTKNFCGDNCFTASSFEEALEIAGSRDVFISGGESLYQKALPLVEKMFITEIDASFEGDTFFPQFDESLFIKEVTKKTDGIIPYTYLTYTRKAVTH